MKSIIRWFFVIITLFMWASVSHALTLSEIRTQVRQNIRDTGTAAGTYSFTDALLNGFINEVQKEVNSQTWAVEKTTSITTVASTAFYSLPTDYLATKRVTYTDANSVVTYLNEDSENSVVTGSPDFQRNSIGKPTRYFTRHKKTNGATQLEMGVIPIPNTQSTGTIKMDYIVNPDDLVSDSDEVFNGLDYLQTYDYVIVLGTTLRVKLIQGKIDEAQGYSALYDRAVLMMRDNSSKMPAFHPSAGAAK